MTDAQHSNKIIFERFAILGNIRLNWLISLIIIVFILFTSTGSTLLSYSRLKNSTLNEIDKKLLVAIDMAKESLPKDYHNQIKNENSISRKEYMGIVKNYDRLCLAHGLEYVWSVMEIDGVIYFTSGTSQFKKEHNNHAGFFEVHSNPQAYMPAFETMEKTFTVIKDEWGSLRSVLVPSYDTHGRKYLFGACIKMDAIKNMLQRHLYTSIASGLLLCAIIGGVGLFLTNRFSRQINVFTEKIWKIASGEYGLRIPVKGVQEMRIMADSINTMSSVIGKQIIALEKKERRYRELTEFLPIALFETDEEGNLIFANKSAIQSTGYTQRDIKDGLNVLQVVAPEDHDKAAKRSLQVMQGDVTDGSEYLIKRKDGSVYPGFVNTRRSSESTMSGLMGYIFDLTNLKRSENKLKESEAAYRSMMESMEDAVYICSSDFHIEYMNPAMVKRTGVDFTGETCHKAIHGLYQKCPWCKNDKIMRGESIKYEQVSPKDGKYYHISSSPIFHVDGSVSQLAVFRDVTEIKKMENILQQAQKMEAIGSLAGGIAHDFNNILFPIVGMSELLLEDLPRQSQQYENAQEILKAGKRGSDLVKQILTFSRQAEHKLIPVRVQQVLKEVLTLTRATIPSYIEINQDIQPDCGLVMVDPTQIHQVAMNVITNAFHALDSTGGTITIHLKEIVLEGNELYDRVLTPGRYVLLSISDTGHGMSDNVKAKIFEPYFTTKEPGKGTGIGLAVVYGIIKAHNGDIEVHSEIGKGTTFNIYLPLISRPDDKESSGVPEKFNGGNERILIVDDEESVVRLERQMLERLGYQVTSRVNSLEALEAFRARPYSFDLVISDMTMPNMTGDQLATEVKSIRSDTPIIICTGFSERINRDKIKGKALDGLLMKPIIKAEMAKMVRKVLDEVNSRN